MPLKVSWWDYQFAVNAHAMLCSHVEVAQDGKTVELFDGGVSVLKLGPGDYSGRIIVEVS